MEILCGILYRTKGRLLADAGKGIPWGIRAFNIRARGHVRYIYCIYGSVIVRLSISGMSAGIILS